MRRRDVTRLAFERRAEQDGTVTGAANRRLNSTNTSAGRRGQHEGRRREYRVARLGGFVRRIRQRTARPRAHRAGNASRWRGHPRAWWGRALSDRIPITAGSSSGTSEMATVTSRAGWACSASRPPLMRERCLRSVFISVIGAPQASNARVTVCFSRRDRPAAGAIQFAEAPPISCQHHIVGPSRDRPAPGYRGSRATPASSGTGCPASTRRTTRNGRA